MVPKLRMTKKWPQKTLQSFIFQNHVTDSLNQIKATNNKKKTTMEPSTHIGVNQYESKTQVTDNPKIEKKT